MLPGHKVVVLGYTGEPAIRLDARGVAANERSLTAAGAGLLKQAPLPTRGAPRWHLISSPSSVIWHDARLHGLPPGQTRRPWSVPLVVDGTRSKVGGELVRAPSPSPWLWVALGLVAVATAFAVSRRGPHALRVATIWLGLVATAATLATAAGLSFASNATGGAWIEAANVLAVALVGLAFVVRGSLDTRALAAGALGMLALAVGLSNFQVFLHGIVLSAFPSELARASVAVAISVGGAAFATGLLVFFDVLEHYDEHADLQARL